MVYEPEKSYAYFKREDSFAKAEDIGNGSSEKHLPFNTLLKFAPPHVKYKEESRTAFSSLGKTLVYNAKYESEESSNEALFRGYLFMLAGLWTEKTVQATWDGTADVITGDVSDTTHRNTLSVNMHIHDTSSTNHIDKTFIGTVLTKWGLKCEEIAGPVIEFWDWMAADVRDDAQAPDIDAGLDDGDFDRTGVDGGFENWDGELSSNYILGTDITITKGGSALSGVQLKNFTLTIECPKTYHYAFSQRSPVAYTQEPRLFKFEAEVIVTNETYLTEVLTLYNSKTIDTFKLEWDSDKYIQCTNTEIKEFNYDGVPEAGKPLEATLIIEGGEGFAPSFSWTGDEATDPSNYITHT